MGGWGGMEGAPGVTAWGRMGTGCPGLFVTAVRLITASASSVRVILYFMIYSFAVCIRS